MATIRHVRQRVPLSESLRLALPETDRRLCSDHSLKTKTVTDGTTRFARFLLYLFPDPTVLSRPVPQSCPLSNHLLVAPSSFPLVVACTRFLSFDPPFCSRFVLFHVLPLQPSALFYVNAIEGSERGLWPLYSRSSSSFSRPPHPLGLDAARDELGRPPPRVVSDVTNGTASRARRGTRIYQI